MTRIKIKLFKFPQTFWIGNLMELFERWAYYGMFAVLSVYLTDPVSEGGLGFSQEQRGIMQAIVTGILYILPILGGAIADKFGYRKVLLSAFVTLAAGYYFMGQFNGYGAVFASFLIVAVGAAIFKPIIVATVSKTSGKGSDTIGFGIFYMIVNIGGFIGPFIASKLRDISWSYVFIMCAIVISINFLLLYFYREPKKNNNRVTEPFSKSIKQILKNTIIVLKDLKFVLFIIIMVGFWTMYMQIFFTLPVFITQWIDTSVIYNSSDWLANVIGAEVNGKGIIRPEMMQNLAALTIIIFQVLVSTLVMKVRPIMSITFGIAVVALGMGQIGFQINGWYVIMGIIIIAFGEMASSPRIQEYIGRIAPKDKVALYMGYSFLPLAGGNILGGLLSGNLYTSFSDKYLFLKDTLVNKGLATIESLNGVDNAVLFKQSLNLMNMSESELTNYLYCTYHPGYIWYIFGGIGIITFILLFTYDRILLKSK